jgi:hypothetical protein
VELEAALFPAEPNCCAIHSCQSAEPGRPGHNLRTLSPEFRLRPAIKVVDVSINMVQQALSRIDAIVVRIQSSALRENNSGNIPNNWEA